MEGCSVQPGWACSVHDMLHVDDPFQIVAKHSMFGRFVKSDSSKDFNCVAKWAIH